MKKLHGIVLTTAALIVGTAVANKIAKSSAAPKRVVTTVARAQSHKKADVKFDLSIRYVDSFAAIRDSSEGKVVAKELEKKRDELTREIKEMEQMFTAEAKDLQAKLPTLSESGREREQKKMVKMEREYKAKLQESDEDMKITMQSAQERLLREHNDAVVQYAQAGGIDLVFGPAGVVYSSEKASCTLDVVKNMDKKYEVKLAQAKGRAPSTAVASRKMTGRTAAAA